MTPLDEAVAIADQLPGGAGGTQILALACGVSSQFINRMRREYRATGFPPRALREHAPAIEIALDGQIRVERLYPTVRWLRDGEGRVSGYVVQLTGIRCSADAANDDAGPAEGESPVEGAG